MSPLTRDEQARAAEMLRFPERYDDAEARALADKLEAEPAADSQAALMRDEARGALFDLLQALAPANDRRSERWEKVRDAEAHARRIIETGGLASTERWSALLRERDEAREALRDLLGTLRLMGVPSPCTAPTVHALVPHEHCLNAGYGLRKLAGHGDFTIADQRVLALAAALEAAGRGESPEWPS